MKCIKCGIELKKGSNFCSSCGTNQTESKKSNNWGLIILSIIGLITIVGLSLLGYFIFSKPESKNEFKNNIIYDDNYITFDKYNVKILDGFKYFTSDNSRYLRNDYCIIEFTKYPISITQINNNKEHFINTLENNGYKIVDYIDNDEKDYITIKAYLDETEYGLAFYTIDDVTIFFKLVSNNLSKFNDEWFDYIKDFINNIVKEEENE